MSEFKAPEALKSEERKLEQSMESMVALMSRMYKNQVLLALNKSTIDKFTDSLSAFTDSQLKVVVNRKVRFIDGYKTTTEFEYDEDDRVVDSWEVELPIFQYKDELMSINPKLIAARDRWKFSDEQAGNYAAVLTKLANSFKRKILKRFSNAKIKNLAADVLLKNDRRSKKAFYEGASQLLGIDPIQLMKDGTQVDINALILETTQWAKKLRDETLEEYTANTLRAMTLGEPIETILQQYDGLVEKRKGHAKFTARNQVASFNSILNKTRAQKLGITKAIWVSSSDERTRHSHDWRDGKEFDLSVGLFSSIDGKTLLPGTDYQCRCGYKMIISDDE